MRGWWLRRYTPARPLWLPTKFPGGVDSGLSPLRRFEGGLRSSLAIGVLQGFIGLLKFLPGLIGLDLLRQFGVIGQHANVIIEDFDEPAGNRQNVRSASSLIAENAGAKGTEQGSVSGQDAHVAILAG